MKKILSLIFVAMLFATNIRSQMSQYQLANIPLQERTLVLDSVQIESPKLKSSQVNVFSETSAIESLPTTFISTQIDSAKITKPLLMSTRAAYVSTGQSVGQINYTSGVSQNGAAYINVPIELPQAPVGYTPDISFTYNSMARRSDLGEGWLLSGISAITRTTKNKYYDNNPEGISSTWSDAFLLDGSRLIRTSTAANEDNYISETGNIKVVAYKKTIDAQLTISHFKVMYPNGLVATYGFSTETVVLSTYPITQITDIFGNSTTFTYDIFAHNGNHYRVTGIQYGKNKEYQVEFKYRGTGTVGAYDEYIGGYKYARNALIEYVHVKYNSNLLRTYTLSYNMSEIRALQSISLSNGSSSMNTLNFTYGDNSQTKTFKNKGTSQMMYWYNFTDPSAIRTVRGKFEYGSQNDGLVVLPNKVSYLEYKNGSTNYIYNKYTGDEDIMISSGLADAYSMPNPKIKTGVGFIDILCANLDQFEEEEIIKINNYVSGSYDRLDFYVYTPNLYYGLVQKYKRTFDFSTLIDVNGRKNVTPKRFFTGDFNGDGKTELLVVSGYNTMGKGNATKIYLFDLESNTKLYEGSYFNYYFLTPGEGTNNVSQIYIINFSDELFVGDFNGDGKSDILLIGDGNTRLFSFDSTNSISTQFTTTAITRSTYANRFMMSGEFTGDGKTDLILAPIFNSTNTSTYTSWTIYASTGLGFYSTVQSIPGAYNKPNMVYGIQDLNKDGITDLTKTDQSLSGNTNFYAYTIRNGKLDGTASVSLTKNSITVPVSLQSSNDFNSLIVVPPSGGLITRYDFDSDYSKENVLSSFTDSYGIATAFKYNRLNEKYNENGPFYSAGYGAVFPFYNYDDASFMVVTSHKETLKSTLIKDLRYYYSNAVIHKQGLGFQGFEQVTTSNNISYNNSETITNEPYNWGVMKSRKSPSGNIFESNYEYNITVNPNKTRRITVKKATEKDLLKTFTKIIDFTYDSYDNALTKVTDFGSGIKTTKTKKYNYHTGTSLYMLDEVYEESDKNEVNGLSSTSKKVLTFNSLRQPLTIQSYINDNLVEDVANTYTSNNLTETRKKPYTSVNWLSTKYTYDLNGRILRTTNHLGLYVDNVYNAKGELASVKDYKGLETKYEYDGWGRKIKTTSPDGVIESIVLDWATSPTNALTVATKSVTGKPTSQVYSDALGREIRKGEMRFDGKYMYTDIVYDSKGQMEKSSLPFKGTAPTLWNTYTYDTYDRITSLTYASGKKDTYAYDKNKVTATIDNVAKTTTYNAIGKAISVVDPAGTITYNYRPDGQSSSIVAPGNITTSFEYDNYGRRTKLIDPSAGTIVFTYDAAGNLNQETDARGKVTKTTYDTYNRINTKEIVGELTTTYAYNTDGQIASVTGNNATSKVFTYDNLMRLSAEKENVVEGKFLQKTYTYSGGTVASVAYTSNLGNIVTENNVYTNGHLTETKLNNVTSIWKLTAENDLGLPTTSVTGALTRTYGYDAYGLPTVRSAKNATATIQNFGYAFNAQTGNLTWRKEVNRNIQENFGYDNLNRLTTFNGKTITYDVKGNITDYTTIGKFEYNLTGKPYMVSDITPYGTEIAQRLQTITYNGMMRPASISENNTVTSFVYNNASERVKMYVKNNGADQLQRYYIDGQYEIDVRPGTTEERLYLGGDAYSAAAVYVRAGTGAWAVNYICRDYLGSITHVTDAAGNVRQELSYDPWGRLRNPVNQVAYAQASEVVPVLGSRGYTGHEHIINFGLINMNARLYDPVVGRFLSPDPYVQAPDMSQNFNRYSYCVNNPLRYNDESGEIFGSLFGALKDIFTNTFVKAWSQGFNAWSDKDNWHSTRMGWEIDKGLFTLDPNKSFGEKVWELISRFTWQLDQTTVGYLFAVGANTGGAVNNVTHGYGMTAVDMGLSKGAITIGNYSAGPKGYKADWRDHLFVHEYGHYIQSQQIGPAYLLAVGIPSLQSATIAGYSNSAPNHDNRWFEADASYKGMKYFNKHYGSGKDGYTQNSSDYFDRYSFVEGGSSPYINPRTGKSNWSPNPIKSNFHWTDITTYIPGLGLIYF